MSHLTSAPIIAFVALGSNLGDQRRILEQAFVRLQDFSTALILRSSLWRSSPVDCPPGSPDFLNAVAALVPLPAETPETLLTKLQSVEHEFGRQVKAVLNEPRPLDLDLIAFGRDIRCTNELILPHPSAHLRRFVLEPLREVSPDFILPGQTLAVCELLAGCLADELMIRL